MSGKIRQLIGLTRRRLEKVLESYSTLQPALDAEPAVLDDETLYETFEAFTDVKE